MKYKHTNTDPTINSLPRLDLKINLKNFGPISTGSIRLSPLTIFIGPNNSGKSYAALLVHSILSSEKQSFEYKILDMNRNHALSALITETHKDLEKIIKNKRQDFFIPASLIKKITTHIIQHIFKENLENTISSNFGSNMGDLVTAKSKSAEIRISNSANYAISIRKKLSIRYSMAAGLKYKIKFSKKSFDAYISNKADKGIITVIVPDTLVNEKKELTYFILDALLSSITEMISKKQNPRESFYIPAARSGILLGYRAISTGIIRDSQYGVGLPSEPKLTGVVSSIVSNIIMLDTWRGHFYNLAKSLESEILKGEVHAVTSKNSMPEIVFRTSDASIPLHRTSSIISEIASISLYLKHIVLPNNMLIIEEPEAHLHPANQKIFAKYVVRMIREGLNVLLTTHSPILLEELGKYMRSNMLKPKERKMLKWDKNDYLKPEEVSPYVFERLDKLCYNIRPIKTDTEHGIPQDEFIRVTENLYDEAIKLQEILDKK